MSDPTDILHRLVTKALENGWDAFVGEQELGQWEISGGQLHVTIRTEGGGEVEFWYSETEVLFNQGFAKALWGDDFMTWANDVHTDSDTRPSVFSFSMQHGERWRYALSHLAPQDDRLSWAEEYLNRIENERLSEARFHADTQADATEEEQGNEGVAGLEDGVDPAQPSTD